MLICMISHEAMNPLANLKISFLNVPRIIQPTFIGCQDDMEKHPVLLGWEQ